jgi:hypothetical protein
MPPIEFVDLDLDAHKAKCTRCRLYALCPEGQRLVREASVVALLTPTVFTWRVPT